MAVRRFSGDFAVLEDEETRLVAFGENAVYGVELAFPESDDDAYRVDLTRTTREPSGIERAQRLTLHEYDSHMEAEEGLREVSDALFERGRDAITDHLPQLEQQPAEYSTGLMVVSYPPDAIFTGEEASVSLIAVTDTGIQDAMVGWNLPPHEASALTTLLEEAQVTGGTPLLLDTAMEEAQTRGQLEEGQPLFGPMASALLDERDVLERDAEIVQPDGWGWHEARFAVLPEGETYQVALLDVYRGALTGDLAGSYLPLGEHESLTNAERQRETLEAAAFDRHDDSSDWARFAEEQVENPVWQPMQAEHYELYEQLSAREIEDDLPADMDPLLAEAMRLGAVITDLDREEESMNNTFQADRSTWEVDLNEHVTHLPPHVTAEYRSPENAEGVAPVRLRPQGNESMYGFEVSAPDESGDVTLVATKSFESEILQKPVTESAILKTYRAADYDESVSYLDPRSDALSDTRVLVYEWGRGDLDHSMGTALRLAQENGFTGDALFEQGPPDTFAPVEDARTVETIRAERDWERDAEIFGVNGHGIALPETTIHAREVGRYRGDDAVPPGQFYGVIVREEALQNISGDDDHPIYVVEGVKAWLDRDGETDMETVTLDVQAERDQASALADSVLEEPDVTSRLARMEGMAHDFAGRAAFLELPLAPEGEVPASQLDLTVHAEALFIQGPPLQQPEEATLPAPSGRLASPIGAYVDRHAGDYIQTDGALVTGYDGQDYRVIGTAELPVDLTNQSPADDIQYQVLPTDTLPDSDHPAEYDPVRMRPVEHGIPADHPAEYAFEVQHMRHIDGDELVDSYHLVEVVKTWHDPDLLPDEPDTRLTLSLPLAAYDDKEAAFETAHQLTAKWWAEGIQPAMQDAANMAQAHINPNIMDVENGHLFGMGPEDPFTVEFAGREHEVESEPAPQPSSVSPQRLEYSRTIGEAAYDLPLEEGQAYAFRMRPIPELDMEVARYGVDAIAVETVKHWQEEDVPQQEVVTLGIHYDRDEARQEVDTYVDLGERDGIQAAMTRAAMLADIQNYPTLVERAEELDIHPNTDVRYGDMFAQGPDDPFLSERDINHAAQQYAADHPPHHRLSLEVVPVQDNTGQALGHSVLALDAAWEHEEPSRELEDAQGVTAYEVAQFETSEGADFYRLSLSEYMGKREIAPEGGDISGAVDFVKAVGESNGLPDNERWLAPWDIAQLSRGEWVMQHDPADFHPMAVEGAAIEEPVEVILPDMDL